MSDHFDEIKTAEALKDPRGTFGTPQRLLRLKGLPLSDRVEILEAWRSQEITLSRFSDNAKYRSLYKDVCSALDAIRDETCG